MSEDLEMESVIAFKYDETHLSVRHLDAALAFAAVRQGWEALVVPAKAEWPFDRRRHATGRRRR